MVRRLLHPESARKILGMAFLAAALMATADLAPVEAQSTQAVQITLQIPDLPGFARYRAQRVAETALDDAAFERYAREEQVKPAANESLSGDAVRPAAKQMADQIGPVCVTEQCGVHPDQLETGLYEIAVTEADTSYSPPPKPGADSRRVQEIAPEPS